ncbi:cystathionine gamma-lyase-like protein, partial [Aphelenchoides avenae]
VVTLAVSLGGYESLAEAPYTMAPPLSEDGAQPPGITPNLVRLSVGCEDKQDLIADLEQALTKAIIL